MEGLRRWRVKVEYAILSSFWYDSWVWHIPLSTKFFRLFSISGQHDRYVGEVDLRGNVIWSGIWYGGDIYLFMNNRQLQISILLFMDKPSL